MKRFRLSNSLCECREGDARNRIQRWITTGCALIALMSWVSAAAEYQWSIPMPKSPTGERRAYLWIPPDAQRVRGLIIGLDNMLEKAMFEDPVIRRTAAECGLGIVWIAPGSEGKGTPLDQEFSPRNEAAAVLQQTLAALAKESGYGEVEFLPLLAVGHSAATPFVWGIAEWNPSRVLAIIPIKGWYPSHAPPGIPVFHISQEWTEWTDNWGEDWVRRERPAALKLRAEGDQALVAEFLDAGAGHFDWTSDSADVVAMFIRKAVRYRLPETDGGSQPVELKPIDFRSGSLIDAFKLGTPEGKPVNAVDSRGEPKNAFWYFDRELADAVNRYAMERLSKKPQAIDFLVDGQPAPLIKGGFADFHPPLQPDGVTFKVAATFLERSPTTILFAVCSGGLRQTGPDTFKVALDRGSIARQGPPWGPWVLARQPGDKEYRSADRPAHAWISMRLTDGTPQTIRFPEIPDQHIGVKSLKLQAVADSGLPVQYFVISGPVELNGDTLSFAEIPPRTRFPTRVIIGAYQWGRDAEPKVQSAGLVVRSFAIVKP